VELVEISLFLRPSFILSGMFRRFAPRLQAAAPEKRSKMQTLHKLLTGEIQFKNKALLKESNVEYMFGAEWKAELGKYASALPADQKAVLERQVSRLSLTRFTTRELAQFAGDGPAGVEAAAQSNNIAEGSRFLAAKGDAEFTKWVQTEAGYANWTADQTNKFIAAVKAAGKK
jgi:hypothetical protein